MQLFVITLLFCVSRGYSELCGGAQCDCQRDRILCSDKNMTKFPVDAKNLSHSNTVRVRALLFKNNCHVNFEWGELWGYFPDLSLVRFMPVCTPDMTHCLNYAKNVSVLGRCIKSQNLREENLESIYNELLLCIVLVALLLLLVIIKFIKNDLLSNFSFKDRKNYGFA